MGVQHIIQHHVKRVYWSLESRRPDSVWVEWMPNTSGTDPGFQAGGPEISEKKISNTHPYSINMHPKFQIVFERLEHQHFLELGNAYFLELEHPHFLELKAVSC